MLAQIFGHPCWISSFHLAAFRPHRSFFRRASHSEIGVWKKGVRERVWTSCTLVRLNSTVLVGRLVITQSGRRSLVTSCFPANSTSAAAADPRDFSTRENEISTIHYYPAALLSTIRINPCPPFHSRNNKIFFKILATTIVTMFLINWYRFSIGMILYSDILRILYNV